MIAEETAPSMDALDEDEVRLGNVILSALVRPLPRRGSSAHLYASPRDGTPVGQSGAGSAADGDSRRAHLVRDFHTARFSAPSSSPKRFELAQQRLADHDRAPTADQAVDLNEAATRARAC